jgi:hypothetical protein
MPQALEGRCLCGQVRYRVDTVFDAGYCHCSICRRITGTPALTWLAVPENAFAIVSGQVKDYRSSEHFVRSFCAECGTHLFGRDQGPANPKVGFKLVSVAIGTLDHPELVAPRIHQWYADRVHWYKIDDNLPRVPDGRLPHPAKREPSEP